MHVLYLARVASFDREITGEYNWEGQWTEIFPERGLLGLFEKVRCFEMDSAIGIKYTVPRKSSKGNHFLLLLSYVSL